MSDGKTWIVKEQSCSLLLAWWSYFVGHCYYGWTTLLSWLDNMVRQKTNPNHKTNHKTYLNSKNMTNLINLKRRKNEQQNDNIYIYIPITLFTCVKIGYTCTWLHMLWVVDGWWCLLNCTLAIFEFNLIFFRTKIVLISYNKGDPWERSFCL